MFNKRENKLLIYAVTDRKEKSLDEFYNDIEKALSSGIDILQLREKNIEEILFLEEAKVLKNLCDKYNVPLIINDNVDIALKVNADGVHLGTMDMDIDKARKILGKDKIIGASARDISLANDMLKKGANYLGVGDVFGTKTKADAKFIGIEALKEISESVDIPIFAIGGISFDNIDKLNNIKISGVALSSAIFTSSNIEKEVIKIKEKLMSLR